MSFAIFVDSGCNLPARKLQEFSIRVISFSYELEGRLVKSPEYPDGFDGHSYYQKLREGVVVNTSLINAEHFCDAFRPVLAQGQDVIYVGISSGISGTFQSSRLAAAELREEFPERKIRLVDSKGAGLGTGLLALKAGDYRAQGLNVDETADRLEEDVKNLCEFFIVDNLMFLKHTGRVSGATAAIGTVLHIKPILRGDEEGHIVACGKVRGRKKAIAELAELYRTRIVDAKNARVAISHGDCLEDAEALAERLQEIARPKELILAMHEPLTGAHVGPGMLAVFFFGEGR